MGSAGLGGGAELGGVGIADRTGALAGAVTVAVTGLCDSYPDCGDIGVADSTTGGRAGTSGFDSTGRTMGLGSGLTSTGTETFRFLRSWSNVHLERVS